jgi:hypothetical protein
VQTHADLRIGMLVQWHGDDTEGADVDDLGIVVKMPGADFHGYYHVAWSITNTVSHHSPEMIEESLYQRQMEIVSRVCSRAKV